MRSVSFLPKIRDSVSKFETTSSTKWFPNIAASTLVQAYTWKLCLVQEVSDIVPFTSGFKVGALRALKFSGAEYCFIRSSIISFDTPLVEISDKFLLKTLCTIPPGMSVFDESSLIISRMSVSSWTSRDPTKNSFYMTDRNYEKCSSFGKIGDTYVFMVAELKSGVEFKKIKKADPIWPITHFK